MNYRKPIFLTILTSILSYYASSWIIDSPDVICVEMGGSFDFNSGICKGLSKPFSNPLMFFDIIEHQGRISVLTAILILSIGLPLIWTFKNKI